MVEITNSTTAFHRSSAKLDPNQPELIKPYKRRLATFSKLTIFSLFVVSTIWRRFLVMSYCCHNTLLRHARRSAILLFDLLYVSLIHFHLKKSSRWCGVGPGCHSFVLRPHFERYSFYSLGSFTKMFLTLMDPETMVCCRFSRDTRHTTRLSLSLFSSKHFRSDHNHILFLLVDPIIDKRKD